MANPEECASPFCKAPLIGKRAKAKFHSDHCRLDFWALRRVADLMSRIEPTEALKVLADNARLKRGEFICRKCGLRKDAEPVAVEF